MSEFIRHIAGLAEIVEDVDAAVEFYRDVLGLHVNHDTGSHYATVDVSGVLHFGIWHRSLAAEATFGDPDAAEKIPMGFTIGFEVGSVDEARDAMKEKDWPIAQDSKKEPWGQVTSRYFSPSGALCEISETPWAREITQNLEASGSD